MPRSLLEILLEKKDPKKVFEATAFHFMDDETRQKAKIKFIR